MREIVLDTETTGLEPSEGHRLVELACLELRNHVPTKEHRRWYFNPERAVPEDAIRIHGLTDAFLSDKPLFAEVADEFLAYVEDAPLVIHNASFDLKFLDAELALLGRPPIRRDRVVDTLAMARRRFPGAKASLDALCQRFEIDNSARTYHGALLDAELLAEVYLELLGGRQTGMALDPVGRGTGGSPGAWVVSSGFRPPRPHAPSEAELAAHAAMLKRLSDPLWGQD